jgi:hypothetical protein
MVASQFRPLDTFFSVSWPEFHPIRNAMTWAVLSLVRIAGKIVSK